MHIAIDVVAGVFLLFAFLAGWYRGFALSLLGVARTVVSVAAAYFAGRYLGNWIGLAAHRPRIVTIPAAGGMAFILVFFAFYLAMQWIRENHAEKVEKEDHRRPFISGLAGGAISLAVAVPVLLLFFWTTELFLVGVANTALPGLAESHAGRATHQAAYRIARILAPAGIDPDQADALARSAASPAQSMDRLEEILTAPSVEGLRTNKQVVADILSGDPETIRTNAAIQQVLADRPTLRNLRDLGILSSHETKTSLCEKLASWGKNEKIRASFNSLRERDLFHTDKLALLLRDPDFDTILGEIVKPTDRPSAEEPPPQPARRPSPSSGE